jgi:alpha-tubulin suppressor-like RCC1 family protein
MYKKLMHSRAFLGITAMLLCAAIILTGTLAYINNGDMSTAEVSGESIPRHDIRMIENYSEPATDVKAGQTFEHTVTAKNFGYIDLEDEYYNGYVRIALKEYLEYSEVELQYSTERFMTDEYGEFYVYATEADAQAAHPNNEVTNKFTNADEEEVDAYDAVSDRSGWFVRTKAGDENGQYGRFVCYGAVSGEASPSSLIPGVENASADAEEEHDAVSNGECLYTPVLWPYVVDELWSVEPEEADDNSLAFRTWVQLNVDYDNFISLSDFEDEEGNDGAPVAKWIYNDQDPTDYYLYWGQSLDLQNETWSPTDSFTILQAPQGSFYYALHADMEAASLDALTDTTAPAWGAKTADAESYTLASPGVPSSILASYIANQSVLAFDTDNALEYSLILSGEQQFTSAGRDALSPLLYQAGYQSVTTAISNALGSYPSPSSFDITLITGNVADITEVRDIIERFIEANPTYNFLSMSIDYPYTMLPAQNSRYDVGDIIWYIEDSSVVSVNNEGMIFGIGNGKTALTGVLPSGARTSATITVTTAKLVQLMNVSPGSLGAYTIDSSGRAYMFGVLNKYESSSSTTPILMDGDGYVGMNEKVEQIVASNNATLILTERGKLYVYGSNSFAEFGNGTDIGTTEVPVLVDSDGFLHSEKTTQIAASENTLFALTESGKLYAWGESMAVETGIVKDERVFSPQLVNGHGLLGENEKVTKVVATSAIAAALTESGKIYVWGSLGASFDEDAFSEYDNAESRQYFPSLVDVVNLGGETVTEIYSLGSIESANNGIYVITDSGKLYAMGWNGYGLVGDGTHDDVYYKLSPVDSDGLLGEGEQVTQIASNTYCTLALTEDGNVYVWGNLSFYGGAQTDTPTLLDITDLGSDPVVQLSASKLTAYLLTESGKQYAIGLNDRGTFGTGNPMVMTSTTPVRVKLPDTFYYNEW